MANAKKIGIIDIVVLGILVICLLFSIIGVSIDGWWTVKIDEDAQGFITQEDVDEIAKEYGGTSIGDILEFVGSDEYENAIKSAEERLDEINEMYKELENSGFANSEELGYLKEYINLYEETLGYYQKLPAICAFAIMTVLMLAIAVAVAVVKLFANNGILRIVLLAAAVAALLFAIIAAAITGSMFDFVNDLMNMIGGESITDYVKPVLGAASALLLVGGLLGGVAGAVGFFLGKKKA